MRMLVPSCLLAAAAAGAVGCNDSTGPTAATEPAFARVSVAALSSTVRVSPSADSLAVGATRQLSAVVLDRRGRPVAGAPVAWTSADTNIAVVSASGLVKGVAAGAVVIRAASGAFRGSATLAVVGAAAPPPAVQPAPPPPAPAPPAPADAGPWTRCAAGGEICFGLVAMRDVRLVAPSGAAVTRAFYGQALCDPVSFGGQNPAPGTPLAQLRCEYGPLKTQTLVNPMPGMAGLPATVKVALGHPGASAAVRVPTAAQPSAPQGDGAFRIQCRLAKFAFDDPIVSPGQPGAAHLHVFFGNTAIDASSTPQSLAATGNSTCIGGTLNRTAYWAPALFDANTGEVQTPVLGTFYYKTGYNVDVRTVREVPAGLRMIAGNKNNTGYQEYATWSCATSSGTSSIPANCPAGDQLRLTITFPQCWDGVNLDSPDHKSHMAYPAYSNVENGTRCPATHPVMLPVITEFFDYLVPAAGATARWRLSSDMYASSMPGGLSAHADWMMAWDAATMRAATANCLVAGRDCAVGLLGDGTALQFP